MGMIELGPRDEINKIYNKPANRKLKYCSVGAISITAILLLSGLIWMDRLSYIQISLIRGFAGLSAIIFVILYAVLLYRVNRDYLKSRHK